MAARRKIESDEQPKTETYLTVDNYGNPQIRKVRKDSWTNRDKVAFLDHLAATCNIKASCAAIGRYPGTARALCRRDPDFADAFNKALRTGYTMLEAMLIERAIGSGPIPVGKIDIDAENMDTELALRLMAAHAKRMQGEARAGRRPYKRVSENQTNAVILKRLRALHRRLQKEAGNDSVELDGN
ncbi:MAG: hypothetical protein ACRCY3_06990 [Sphingorhabdus sp.]